RRLDPANININTWEARSANGGASWTSRRISTRSWNPNLGFFSSGAFIGDQAERNYDLNRAAELRLGRLPDLERKLRNEEENLVSKGQCQLLRQAVTEEE